MKKPRLNSFDLFCPCFGDGPIHERLSVCLSLNTNDMEKIGSNTCFTLKIDNTLPIKESAISSPHPTTTRATT